jgi:hypothetical protein
MYFLISNIVLTYLDVQSFRVANPDTGHYHLAAGLKCLIIRRDNRMLTKTHDKTDGDRVKITEVLSTQCCAFFQ